MKFLAFVLLFLLLKLRVTQQYDYGDVFGEDEDIFENITPTTTRKVLPVLSSTRKTTTTGVPPTEVPPTEASPTEATTPKSATPKTSDGSVVNEVN